MLNFSSSPNDCFIQLNEACIFNLLGDSAFPKSFIKDISKLFFAAKQKGKNFSMRRKAFFRRILDSSLPQQIKTIIVSNSKKWKYEDEVKITYRPCNLKFDLIN